MRVERIKWQTLDLTIQFGEFCESSLPTCWEFSPFWRFIRHEISYEAMDSIGVQKWFKMKKCFMEAKFGLIGSKLLEGVSLGQDLLRRWRPWPPAHQENPWLMLILQKTGEGWPQKIWCDNSSKFDNFYTCLCCFLLGLFGCVGFVVFHANKNSADGPNMTLIDSRNVSGEQICGPFDTFATLL